ncbi:hypothetical protein PIROE2DRAFT_4240 [Piromyces sp. E2]|nr:hypothetical protein PIROE2DRAFT_4240 [Piromyces sp. E2]|eukprot:OUM68105.1 hypothetical protein PIROE2DRAFT_4240 [Piromyces sp. E2]
MDINLKININAYQENMNKLQLLNDYIYVTIKNCSENQMKVFKEHKYNKVKNLTYFYCENALCSNKCPTMEDKAECVFGNDNSKNIKELNICKCKPGYDGEYCSSKVFVKFNPYFNLFEDYFGCAFNLIFKHLGVFTIAIIYAIYLCTEGELGMNYFHVVEKTLTSLHQEESAAKYDNVNEKQKHKSSEKSSMSLEEIILRDTEKRLNLFNSTYNKPPSYNTMDSTKLRKGKNDRISFYKHESIINKNNETHFNSVHDNDLYIINKKTNANNDSTDNFREDSGKFRYSCPLETFNLLLNGIEMAFIIILILKVLKVWSYVYVFKHIKYLGYSLLIWITLGPLIEGDSPECYFIFLKYEECTRHKSFSCDCKPNQEELNLIVKYIELYNFCSKIIINSGGNFKQVQKKKQDLLKFII